MPGEAAAPVVSSVSPASGTIGAEVTITVSGFAEVTGVKFGTAASKFTVGSTSQIAATVPAGASTGPVTVTGPGRTASSPKPFTVTPGIAVSALSGPPATVVTVSGAGFAAYEAVDIYFAINFGITHQALAIASSTGNFAGIAVQVPASVLPGTADLTAAGRHSGLGAQAQFTVSNPVTVTNPGNQASAIGTEVSLQVQASDSAGGQTLTYTATGLPPGLSIDSSTGLISGSPGTAGSFAVTVSARAATGASGSAAFGWTIHANAVTVTKPGTQASYVGTVVSLQVQASDSAGGQTLTYTATGLPRELSIDSSTGLISGSLVEAGEFPVTVTAQDSTGAAGSVSFDWDVSIVGPFH